MSRPAYGLCQVLHGTTAGVGVNIFGSGTIDTRVSEGNVGAVASAGAQLQIEGRGCSIICSINEEFMVNIDQEH